MGFIALKFRYLHARSKEMDTTKLFVLSVLLSCTMRCLSFVAIGSLDVQSITLHEGGQQPPPAPQSMDSGPEDPDTRFYEKAVLVLFDLPDFMIVSAYVLLALVWAEAFIQSRSHWLSVKQFRRMWLLSYLIFNACLYAGQLVLYTLLFLPNGNQEFLSKVIFLTLTIINFALPVLLFLLFLYLSIMFAGFPYKSSTAYAKVNKITRVVIYWTIGRVLWGCVVLTTIMQGWLTHAHRDRPLYSLVLVGLFLITELIPYLAALDQDLLALIATDARAGDAGGHHHGPGSVASRYGALQQGLTPVSESGGSGIGDYGPPEMVGVGVGKGGLEEGEEGQALYGDALDVEDGEEEEEGKVAVAVAGGDRVRRG